jgi:hypothetical protein
VALARAALVADGGDLLARAVARDADHFAGDLANTASYLAAMLEEGIYAQPIAESSLPAALARLEHERGRLRTYALVALALTALMLGLLVARRGLRAGAEARRILVDAGSLAPPRRSLMLLRVAAVVASLLFVFVAIAIYLVARGQGP